MSEILGKFQLSALVPYVPFAILAFGLACFLAGLFSKNTKAGDAGVVVSFILLVVLSALNENTFIVAYICSVALLALRDMLWLSLEGGRAASPLLHKVSLVYTAALLILIPSLLLKGLLPETLTPVIASITMAALLTYVYIIAGTLRRGSSFSTPQ